MILSEEGEVASPCGADPLPLELYNDLLCPICLEFFKHPIILPCSHVLCRSPCAENLFDFNFIRCPVCRENCYVSGGLTSLPRVIPLESIIDKYRSERRKAIQNARRAVHRKAAAQSSSGVCVHGNRVQNELAGDAQNSEICVGNASSSDINSSQPFPSSNGTVGANDFLSSNALVRNGSCAPAAKPKTTQWHQHGRSRSTSESSGDFSSPASGSEILAVSPRTCLQTSTARREHRARPSVLSVSSTPRSVDRFDASLFDVSTDSVTSCSRHGSEASVYCQACQRCVCDVCGDGDHLTTHVTNSLEEAAAEAKSKLAYNLEKMVNGQHKVLTSLEQHRQRLKDMEQAFHRRSEEVNMQCDSLLAEVEHKRSLFLADLDQEERMRRSEADDVMELLEKILASSQSLAQYTQDVLEKDTASILQVTPALNEQLLGSALDCEACQGQSDSLHPDLLPGKVVDLRKEQTLLRDIRYLNPPAIPAIDLGRCARSENTVALFLLPARHSDVIDSFVTRYCSEDQKALGIEDTLTLDHTPATASTPSGEDLSEWACPSYHSQTSPLQHHQHQPLPHHYHHHHHPDYQSGAPSSLTPLVVILDHLLSGTTYLFCVSAANRAGTSASSEVVKCVTLPASHSVVPVPVILEAMCQTYSTSVRVYTPSPHHVAPEQSISHFLLHRPRDRKRIWRCLALCGRVEQRVYGLEPGVAYEFVVMATNSRGECQVSEKVVLETDRSTDA